MVQAVSADEAGKGGVLALGHFAGTTEASSRGKWGIEGWGCGGWEHRARSSVGNVGANDSMILG